MTSKELRDQRRKYDNASPNDRPFKDGTKIRDAYEEMKDGQFHDWSLLCEHHSVCSDWLRKYLDGRGEAVGIFRLEFVDQNKKMARLVTT